MKTKSIALLSASVLALFLIISTVSAATSFSVSTNALDFTSSGSQIITVKNLNDTEQLTIDFTALVVDGFSFVVSITDDNKTLDANEARDITVQLTSTSDDIKDNLDFLESTSGTFLVENTADLADNETITVKVENSKFCNYANPGDLEMSGLDLNNKASYGGDDDAWYPLSEIEVEFDLDNNGNEDIDGLEFEWALYNDNNEKIMGDEIDEDDFDNYIDEIDEDDSETIVFTIKIDENVDELEDGKYTLFVSVAGETDDNEDTCVSESESVNMIIDKDFVILGDIDFPSEIACGDEVTLTAELWNIGSKNQDDVEVYVYNDALGIKETIQAGDIDSLEDGKVTITFTVPTGIDSKQYYLEFAIIDEDGDIFENDDDETATFIISLNVDECILGKIPPVEVSAVAKSGGIAGGETIVEVTIVNTGSTAETFALRSIGYDSWANEATLDKSNFVINSGESEVITVTLDVKEDALGDNQFDIEIASNGEIVEVKSILVPIEAKSGFSFPNIFKDTKWSLIGIVALNIILVLAIIAVAVKIIRKK